MEMKHCTKIKLYNSYFDLNNNLSLKAILNIFQDVASVHGEEIGVGYEKMLEKNLYWVLSRIKIDILKMPQINQTVLVETWPHEKGRIDFDRDLIIKDDAGEVLVMGASKWCVIDATTRSLARTDMVNYDGEVFDKINYDEKFGKIVLPDAQMEPKFKHTVRFFDLDHNQHMNNTNYASLVINATQNKTPTHFEINFLNECKEGDEIEVSWSTDNTSEYVKGTTNGKPAFVATIK